MIWLFILFVFFLLMMAGLAVVMRSINHSHEKQLDDKAVLLHSKLQREKPDSFLAELERDEFKIRYLASIKARGMSTIVPGIVAFLIPVISLVFGGIASFESNSLLPLVICLLIGLVASVFLGKSALKKHKETKSEEWLLNDMHAKAK